MAKGQSQLLIVGSGISALMSAYQAVQRGYQVCLLSKSPDPRCTPAAIFDSSTWDGSINRYVTLTEGHPYLFLPGYINSVYPGIDRDFLTDLTVGGMLGLPLERWDQLTAEFLQTRSQANQDFQAAQQLFLEYLDENRASLEIWYGLLQQILATDPTLLDRLSLHWQGIDRFYDNLALYESALSSQENQQVVKAFYPAAQLNEQIDFQAYHRGLKSNQPFIQGGAITIYGLSFDVKQLGCWLLDWLESHGAMLHLGTNYEVTAIEKDAAGEVSGLRTRSQQVFCAKHILMHPGAYMAPQVLAGTPAYGKLAGVKGLWLRLRQPQEHLGISMPRPNKVHGGKYSIELDGQVYQGQITDLNVMPQVYPDGSWDLVIGSGYLFVGLYPFVPAADLALAEQLVLRSFVRVVEELYDISIDLPQVLAGEHPWIDLPSSGCVRSWTADDRELRVILPTDSGGALLIDGGGNTGSTTKAPFISQVALDWIDSINSIECQPNRSALADLESEYERIRCDRRRSKAELTATHWQQLENALGQTIQVICSQRQLV